MPKTKTVLLALFSGVGRIRRRPINSDIRERLLRFSTHILICFHRKFAEAFILLFVWAGFSVVPSSPAWASHYTDAGYYPEFDVLFPHTIAGTWVSYGGGCAPPPPGGLPQSGVVASEAEALVLCTEVMRRCAQQVGYALGEVVIESRGWVWNYPLWYTLTGRCFPRAEMPDGVCADDSAFIVSTAFGMASFLDYRCTIAKFVFVNYEANKQYTVRLSGGGTTAATASASSATLTSIEPEKSTALIARVYDQNNQPVPNISVRIEANAVENSGGHKHHDAQRPKGKLNGQNPPIITGTTDAGGGFSFSFTAPDVAGDYKLTASCSNCTQQGPDQVWVGIKDLAPLYGTNLYALIGSDAVHPGRYYLTNPALGQIVWLAQLYHEALPSDPVLHLNDASLERGGLFDVTANWSSQPRGHKTHRFGAEIDIRANSAPGAIPTANFKGFERLVKQVEATTCPSDSPGYFNTSNQHYHVCLMGGDCCQGGNR